MKNQYFGDIGDYTKYSVLRTLSLSGHFKLLICWMLTDNDGRTDGRHIDYLSAPTRWRQYDSQVFDFLKGQVLDVNKRHVDCIEASDFIPDATYVSPVLLDTPIHRRTYFEEVNRMARSADVVFFDPDNGLQVDSVAWGKRGSSKYLYWDEAASVYQTGASVLIYQHYRRVNRDQFVSVQAAELMRRTGAPVVLSLRTKQTMFYLWAIHIEQDSAATACVKRLSEAWGERLIMARHIGF